MRPQTKIAAAGASLLTILAIGVGALAFGGESSREVTVHQANTELAPDEATTTTTTEVQPEAEPAPTPTVASTVAPAPAPQPASTTNTTKAVEERVATLEQRTDDLEQRVAATTTTSTTATTAAPAPTVPPRPCIVGRNCPGN